MGGAKIKNTTCNFPLPAKQIMLINNCYIVICLTDKWSTVFNWAFIQCRVESYFIQTLIFIRVFLFITDLQLQFHIHRTSTSNNLLSSYIHVLHWSFGSPVIQSLGLCYVSWLWSKYIFFNWSTKIFSSSSSATASCISHLHFTNTENTNVC